VEPSFLVGPTAVGKSAVALELVRLLDAEIVSADSMQVYRGMDIGTAKPTPTERSATPHHLIDVCEVNEAFDAKRFVDLATSAISSLKSRGKAALIVGGTGLYIRALRRGLFEGPARDPKLRAKLECKSTAELFEELERVDPQSAAKIDRHNPRRLVRALEVFYATGRSISDLQTQWTRDMPSLGFCLNREREDLYARIDRRIDKQMAAGWVEEVRRLLAHGLEQNATAMQAAGYRELVEHLQGKLSLADAVALIKTRTRQLAKRQLTWFRPEPGLRCVEVENDEPPAQTARRVLKFLQETRATR
jgi:tRNA dimethylallyltransferase